MLSGQKEVKVDRHRKQWLFMGSRKQTVERKRWYCHTANPLSTNSRQIHPGMESDPHIYLIRTEYNRTLLWFLRVNQVQGEGQAPAACYQQVCHVATCQANVVFTHARSQSRAWKENAGYQVKCLVSDAVLQLNYS